MSYLTGPNKAPNPYTAELLSAIDRTIEKALVQEIQSYSDIAIQEPHIETTESSVSDYYVHLDLNVYGRTPDGGIVFCGARVSFNFIGALIWEQVPYGIVRSLWTQGGPKRLGHMLGRKNLALMTGETFSSGWVDVDEDGELTLMANIGLSKQEYIDFENNHPSTYTYNFGDGLEPEIEIEGIYHSRNHEEMEPPAKLHIKVPVPQTFSLDTPWEDIVDWVSPHLKNLLTPGFLPGAKKAQAQKNPRGLLSQTTGIFM